jgi:hypothetical protein
LVALAQRSGMLPDSPMRCEVFKECDLVRIQHP